MGKPDEPSPKARLLSWFGYSTPFDRHDWVVDRCGQDVRYVLDFYQGNQPGVSVHIDARPAVTDSLQNALDYFGDFIRGIF
jgi:cytochrome c heme-lyase